MNKARVGQHYIDVDSAKNYKGMTEKQKLLTDPFIVEVEYGASNKGYWNYERISKELMD